MDPIENPSANRRKTVLRKVIKAILISILLFIAVSVIMTAIVFKVMFPRSTGDTAFSYSYSEIDAAAYPREEFTFESDGESLFGCLYRARDPKGLVVVVNGINNGADSHLPLITDFVDNSWSVATYDATGVGKSGGSGVFGLAQIKIDLESFLDFISKDQRFTGLPVVLFGHSAGGYACAALLEEADGICGAICVSAFDSPNETMLYHARRYTGFLADVEYPFMAAGNYLLFGADADVSAHDAINSTDVPVALISGSSDDVVPYEIGLLKYDGEFENPNVVCLEIDDGERSEHATPWLSAGSAAYVNSYVEGQQVDKGAANELDRSFMDFVFDFYEKAIGADR